MRRLSIQSPLSHFLLTVAVILLVGRGGIHDVLHGGLTDPDSYMRLVRIRDAFIAGHRFTDVVTRDQSGHGLVIPWSHAFDAPILMLSAALPLYWAAVLAGLLSVGLLGMAAWAVKPLAPLGWLWLTPFAIATTAAVINYGAPGCITHHVLLAALVVATWGAGARAAFGDLRSGRLTGLFTALGIWVSPEAMPFGLMAIAAIAFSCVLMPSRLTAKAISASGTALVATLATALLLDPPHAGLTAPEPDLLSIVFLVQALIVGALCLLPLILTPAPSMPARFLVLGTAALGGAGLWLAVFPVYLHGLAGLMTPEQAKAFFGKIQEMQPIDTPSRMALCGLPGMLAVVGAFVMAVANRTPLCRALWLFAATCCLASLALAFVHIRFSIYSAVAAAMILPVLVGAVTRAAPSRWCALLRPALLALFLAAPPISGALLATPAEAVSLKQCDLAEAAKLLAPYPGAVVLTNVNDGPELLYRTRIKIVGSLYHSGIAGFMRLRAAWRVRDLDQPPPELRATGAQYILACPGSPRPGLIDGPPTTLFDRLNSGDAPTWLHPVATQKSPNVLLYKILAR